MKKEGLIKNFSFKKHKGELVIFTILALIIISVFLLNIFFVRAENSENVSEWWMFHKYLNHTGWDGQTFSVIRGLNDVSFTAEGPMWYSSPAVANGYVYIGGGDNQVYQLNASNVSQKFANFTARNPAYSPAVANGYVYIGSDDKSVYQLNASNVSQYIANLSTGIYNFDIGSPAVANGYVYIGGSNAGGTSGVLYQLNASNVSQYIANFTTGIGISSSPAVANGYVYIGSLDNQLYQLNASNVSQKIANFTAGVGGIISSPAVANGYVYIGSLDNNLYQLNASNVSLYIANFTAGGGFISSPAVANGYVYIGGGDNQVYQLNASNVSQKIANFSTESEVRSSPAVANGYVYIGSSNAGSTSGPVYQLNASNISIEIANYITGSAIFYSSPAVANGYVYIGSGDNKVYQLNANNISLESDFIIPNIQIVYPSNNTNTFNSQIDVNYTVSDAYLQACWFSNDTYLINTTLTGCENITNVIWATNTFHNVTIWANDSSGNENYSRISFNVSFCTESWICTDWTTCTNGNQLRACIDRNSCGSTLNKPTESQTCLTGGNGGGGGTITTTQTVSSASPSSPAELSISNPGIDLIKIVINVLYLVNNPSVTVTKVEPPGVNFQIGLPSGKSYQAFEIVTTINSTSIANISLDFKVNKTWLENRNGTIEDLRLYRRLINATEWNALTTTFIKEEAGYYYFSSLSPGFSTFVVFFGKYECQLGLKRCFNSQSQLCLGNATWLITERCSFGCNEQGECIKTAPQSVIIYTVLIAVVSVAIILTLYMIFMRILKKRGKK